MGGSSTIKTVNKSTKVVGSEKEKEEEASTTGESKSASKSENHSGTDVADSKESETELATTGFPKASATVKEDEEEKSGWSNLQIASIAGVIGVAVLILSYWGFNNFTKKAEDL